VERRLAQALLAGKNRAGRVSELPLLMPATRPGTVAIVRVVV
jgi:hypothetical protein